MAKKVARRIAMTYDDLNRLRALWRLGDLTVGFSLLVGAALSIAWLTTP